MIGFVYTACLHNWEGVWEEMQRYHGQWKKNSSCKKISEKEEVPTTCIIVLGVKWARY